MIHIIAKTFNEAVEYALQKKLDTNEYRVVVDNTDLPKLGGTKVEVHFVGRYKEKKNARRLEHLCDKRGIRTVFVGRGNERVNK